MRPLTIKRALDINNNELEAESDKNNSSEILKENILGPKAKKMRRYRENIKSDPQRLQKAREKDKERKRAARAKIKQEIQKGDTELQEKVRGQARQYMRTYRRVKAKNAKTNRNHLNKLQKDNAQQRKEKAVLRTQKWRMRIQMTKSTPVSTNKNSSSTNETENVGSPSRWTVYRSAKKVKEVLPRTPVKKAAVLQKLIESPSTSQHLEEKGIFMTEDARKKLEMVDTLIDNIADNIQEVKPAGTETKEEKAAYDILLTTALKSVERKYKKKHLLGTLGIHRKNVNRLKKTTDREWWKQNPRKARKDRISDEAKLRVKNFYLSQEVSREVPNKKDVVTVKEGDQKEYRSKHVMIATSADAFSLYKTKYSNDKIGFTSFKKLKPQNVRRISETNRKSCLCKACCNVALKVEALKSFVTKHKMSVQIDKKKVVSATLCPTEEGKENRSKCLNRECKDCGVKGLQDYLKVQLEQSMKDDLEITWNKWELITVQKEDKSSKRITSCVAKASSFQEFIQELEKDLVTYSGHRFRATWQQQQMIKCSETLKPDEIMTVMDFSENYKCNFQNEPQDAFFDQNLVTIHPSMNYYKKNINDQVVLVKHSITGISNDLKHDANFVKVFEEKSLGILKNSVSVEGIKQWSDGCAAQYKAKVAFAHLSEKTINTSRSYFETSHGKNVCDGLGAVVKNSCYRAVLTGKIISNSADVYKHCKDSLEHDIKINEKEQTASVREFVYISKEEVNRSEGPYVKTLIGTRKIHNIRNIGEAMKVESRNLSCFCPGCLNGTNCENVEYVQPWVKSDMSVSSATVKPVEDVAPHSVENDTEPRTSSTNCTDNTYSAPPCEDTTSGASNNDGSSQHEQLSIDDFVQVELRGRRSSQQYIGQILEIDEGAKEIRVSYMKRSTTHRQLYFWPDGDDAEKYWASMSMIVKKLDRLVLSNRSNNRMVLFEFKDID